MRFAILALFMSLTMPANAQELAERFIDVAQKQEINEGRFEQTKVLHDFAIPFHSRGEFFVDSQGHLHWETITPVQQSLIITEQGLIGLDSTSTDQPMAGSQIVGSIFLGLITGDVTSLLQYFNAALAENTIGNGWGYRLTPSQLQLQDYLTAVSVQGLEHEVKTIIIEEANGDLTTINLIFGLQP